MIRLANRYPGAWAVGALTAAVAWAGSANAESIDIRLAAAFDTYQAGEAVDIEVLASVPSVLVGYGFDLTATGDLTLTGFDAGPGFVGVAATPDGDRLAGLSFTGGVDGVDVILGTAHFLAGAAGDVQVDLSATAGDLTEGFALLGSGFFDIVTTPLALSIVDPLGAVDTGSGGGGSGGGGQGGGAPPVPEPMTVMLLATGLLVTARRR